MGLTGRPDDGRIYLLLNKKGMAVAEKQTGLKRLFQSKLVIVFEVLLIVLLGTALGKEIIHKYQVEREIQSLQKEVGALDQKNIELKSLITYLNSDTYKEEQARLKLGLQRPGESVITVLGANSDSAAAAAAAAVTAEQSGSGTSVQNPHRWLSYFTKE